MRIGIALIIIGDLIIRVSDISAYYSDQGIWPIRLIYKFGWQPGFWSIHALNGSFNFEISLFFLHFILALFLLLGYKTKIATILIWLFTISLHNRNLFIQQGGDDLIRLILFWGIFLPWNSFYSIDSYKIKIKHVTIANLGFLFLIASVYFFTANLKTSPEWRSEGSAIYYALSIDQLRLPLFGDWLYQFPWLMKPLTHLVFYFEILIPILIILPSKNGILRFIAILLILFLQIGIGSTLYVGIFMYVNIVAALALLPPFIMNKMKIFGTSEIKSELLKKNKINYFIITQNIIGVSVIIISLILNLSSTNWFQYQLKKEINYSVNFLRLNQYWGMFSPYVLKKDGWFVYQGISSKGKEWDLRLNQEKVDYKKPKHVVQMYKTDRSRKLAENMQNDYFSFLRPLYGKYILRQWNLKNPDKKISTLNLYFIEKNNLLNYKTTPLQKKLYCVCTEN